jgi:hypothetical protein
MRNRYLRLLLVLGLVCGLTGCQGMGSKHHKNKSRNDLIIGEPGLDDPGSARVGMIPPGADDPTLVPGNPPRKVQWTDRHPLFRKPAEVYQNTDRGPVVNAAAATVIGIPMGIVGELRQIVVGCPPGF